jgi:hypothetical protein
MTLMPSSSRPGVVGRKEAQKAREMGFGAFVFSELFRG